jgi:hypothetical protein
MGSISGILAASAQDENFRNEMLVGTTSSTLALTTILIFLPPLFGAGDQLRALPDRTPEDRLYKLRVAEGIFQRSAANIDFFTGAFPVTLTSLYVSAAAGTLLLAFNRPTGALTHSIGGAVLGVGRLLLSPTSARSTWRRYRRAYADAACVEAPPTVSYAPRVAIVPHALGLGLRIDF